MITYKKNCDNTSYQRKSIALVIFIVIVSFLMGGWNFRLPGLHMDEVNHAAFVPGILDENAARLHHFRLKDNYLDLQDGTYRYPILGGSFYNSVVTAYLGLPVYKTLGFSFDSIRFFHGGIGFLCVLFGALLVARFAGFLSAYFFTAIVTTNPDFIFSLRSQAATLWPVVLFALAGVHLLLWSQTSINARRQIWLILFAGLCLGFSVMSYFVGAFIVLPILVYAWYGLDKSKKHYFVLLLGLLIGYLPVIYSVISAYLMNPHLLDSFGMPDFAIKNNIAIFSSENIQRTLLLFQRSLGSFSFTKGVLGNFIDAAPTLRTTLYVATAALAFWSLVRRRYWTTPTVLLTISSAILITYLVGAFVLKALNSHHLLPLFFVLALQLSVLISGRSYVKYLSMLLGAMLLVGNTNALILAHNSLEKTGGHGFHNEMFTRSTEIIQSECVDCYPVFISWGMHLQFLFLTEGQQKYTFLPSATADRLKELIYQHGKIILIGSDADLEDIEFDTDDVNEFDSIELKQRDGVPLYKMRMLRIADDI